MINLANKLNTWGREGVPFLFVIDFELEKPLAFRLNEVDPGKILFEINGFTNYKSGQINPSEYIFSMEKFPIPFADYKKKFDVVYDRLSYGDSYLTNLTTKTEIKLKHSLRDLFFQCRAKYKLLFEDQFLVFSPEIFVQIREGKIFSYPMKGTIDAGIPNAGRIIMDDQKELAEHVTIVDLIRNDLSQVASDVHVSKFRYLDEIKTSSKNLLQVSSEVTGTLSPNYLSQLGTILTSLLPAGSVSGAPKAKTLDIIKAAEGEKRGYYTGIFGFFDGYKLDSCVMIRYIENKNGDFFYRSGGGITTQSVVGREYQEMIDKVYVPLD